MSHGARHDWHPPYATSQGNLGRDHDLLLLLAVDGQLCWEGMRRSWCCAYEAGLVIEASLAEGSCVSATVMLLAVHYPQQQWGVVAVKRQRKPRRRFNPGTPRTIRSKHPQVSCDCTRTRKLCTRSSLDMRYSYIVYATLSTATVLTGYLLLRPADRPGQYLKDDGPVIDQGNKNKPAEAKKDVEMSVKDFVDSTIKNNKVVIW